MDTVFSRTWDRRPNLPLHVCSRCGHTTVAPWLGGPCFADDSNNSMLHSYHELPVDVVSQHPPPAGVPDMQETAGGAAGTTEASSGVPVRDPERDCS